MKTYFKAGSWNAVCDACGFRFKSHQLKKRWDGLMVCSKDYELDHPQKYLRVHPDNQTVPFVRPEQESFIHFCDIEGSSGLADMAEADCARADITISLNSNDYTVPQGTF